MPNLYHSDETQLNLDIKNIFSRHYWYIMRQIKSVGQRVRQKFTVSTNHITKISLPPHCSHELQPLDKTVYGPMKTFYNQACVSWMKDASNAGKAMTIHIIPMMLKYAFTKAMTPENIQSGFKVTGIYPFDRNVFSEDRFKCHQLRTNVLMRT